MEIKIKRTDTFIPTWEGNNKADNSAQVVFHLRYLSVGELDDCITISSRKKRNKAAQAEYVVDNKQMFSYAVTAIDNLAIIDDADKRTEITTPELVLSSPGLETLYYEVSGHISKMNARIDSKN